MDQIRLRSDLCNYSDACNIVKETIDLLAAAANENDKAEKNVTFKCHAPFRSCISKTLHDLDIVLSMYNLSK